MRATNSLIFGLVFGFGFSAYFLDSQDSTATLANWLEAARGMDANLIGRILFGFAACLLFGAALLRTWASSYLHSNVVYAAEVKTAYAQSAVLRQCIDGHRHGRADEPDRILHRSIGDAAVLLPVDPARRIGAGGGLECRIRSYRNAVPRLWPAFTPRTAAAGGQASWSAGFRAEFWCWGFAVAVAVFAITITLGGFSRSWAPASFCCGCVPA